MVDDAAEEAASSPQRLISTSEAVEMALDLAKKNQSGQAAAILELVIEAEPDNAVALNYLGILTYHLVGPQASIKILLRAADADPGHAGVRNNLGNAHVELGDIDAAVDAYRDAIRLNPELPDPYGNLASIMRSRGALPEAEQLLREAVRLNEKNGLMHHNLASLLLQTGRKKEAMVHSWKAAALIPDKAVTAPLMALTYWNAGMKEEAIAYVRKWLEEKPGDPDAVHLLASFSGENVPERASDAYVVRLFDSFAQSFDSKLDALDYRAPQLVGEALATFMADSDAKLDIVDAGCGTGKCAAFLKPYARSLHGVDLSGGMLAQAERRKLYDATEKAELTEYLQARPGVFDAVVSADTLCYFGVLNGFAAAAFASLRPAGLLIFTAEALSEGDDRDLTLGPHGRYTHKETYVTNTLENAGFTIVRCQTDSLRMESGEPVVGLVITAQRPTN